MTAYGKLLAGVLLVAVAGAGIGFALGNSAAGLHGSKAQRAPKVDVAAITPLLERAGVKPQAIILADSATDGDDTIDIDRMSGEFDGKPAIFYFIVENGQMKGATVVQSGTAD